MKRKSLREWIAQALFYISQCTESWATALSDQEHAPVIDDSEVYS